MMGMIALLIEREGFIEITKNVYKALKTDYDASHKDIDDPLTERYMAGLAVAMALMRKEFGLDEDGEFESLKDKQGKPGSAALDGKEKSSHQGEAGDKSADQADHCQ